jgi:hypothetical protein
MSSAAIRATKLMWLGNCRKPEKGGNISGTLVEEGLIAVVWNSRAFVLK